jgi:hypothetical protein
MPLSSSRTFLCCLTLLLTTLCLSANLQATELNKTIIFTHIPKAAGVSLNHNVALNVSGSKIQLLYAPPFEQPISKVKENAFFAKPKQELKSYKFIAGHTNYGIHKNLPGDSEYITILRNPLSRVSSAYRYYEFDKNKTVTEFLDAGFYEADNGMVRRLSGIGDSIPIGKVRASHLQQAIKNIEFHYKLAGTLEQYNEFIFMLGKTYDWKMSPSIRENVTQGHPNHVAKLSEDEQALILAHNSLDIALHAFVTQKFTTAFDAQPLKDKIAYIRFIKQKD